MEPLLSRTPAHSTETEEALLSAILIDNSPLEDIAAYLSPEDFYEIRHQKIYRAMISLSRRGQPADLVTVSTSLQTSGELESVGGSTHVAQIANCAPMATNAQAYADMIKSFSLNRQVLQVATRIQDVALKGEAGETVLEMFQSEALKIQSSKRQDTIKAVSDIIGDHLSRIEKANTTREGRRYPTGFANIDRCLSVLGPKLILIAGRPKMGKTGLAVTIMRNMDKLSIKAGILSIEMPEAEIVDKWLAQESQVDSQKFGKYKALSPNDYEDLAAAAGELAENCRIVIDDSGSIGIEDVKRKGRKMVKAGVQVLFIDQLSQIKGRPGTDRFTRFADNCSEIAMLKKELGIPIFLIAQLNRELEKRINKEPTPADLKMTGNLEEDCDAAIFVYRPEVYAQNDQEKEVLKGKAVINLALNRHGSTFRDRNITFKPECSYFYQGKPQ